MIRALLVFLLALCAACADDYPPCSPSQASPWTVEGPTPQPPDPDPGADVRYSKNADGEVCECGPYELGCVESPEAAERAGRPGAFCPYPREDGDPTMGAGPWPKGTCTCFFVENVCGMPQVRAIHHAGERSCTGLVLAEMRAELGCSV